PPPSSHSPPPSPAAVPPETFGHPAYAAVSDAVREAGGTAAGLGGGEWLDAVGKKAEAKGLRSLVTELAVEPMPISEEATPRYISGVLARLQEVWVGRQVAELKSKLQRMSPIEKPEDYNALFGDLIALEQYRRSLLEQAVGSTTDAEFPAI
ncbi:hypothetical protein HQ609_13210, partial [Rhodococcus corynebacterioides]|nr:hypothetical protein [Rhodococcus corynebacterioides]